MTNRSHSRVRDLTTAALLSALLMASAFIVIPAGTVPVTLQVLVVIVAALLMRPSWAFAAVGLYLVAGSAGLPVFSGGNGGLGVLLGPTGGYLVGFALAAFLGSRVRQEAVRLRASATMADVFAAGVVLVVVYFVGTFRLASVLGVPLIEAIAVGVVPFAIPDVVKAIAAVFVARAVRRGTGIGDGAMRERPAA